MSDTPASVALGTQREVQAVGLAQGAAGGDPGALAHLYDATGPEILGFAMHLLSVRDLAEEVLLDTYTDAWRQAPSADLSRGKIVDWLKSLARARTIKKLHTGDSGQRPITDERSCASTPVQPPEYLRDLLLARLEREPQNAARDIFASPFAEGRPLFGTPTAPEKIRTWVPWVLAAALAVTSGILFYNWRESEQAGAEGSNDAAAASRATEQLREKMREQAVRIEELNQIDAVLHTPGARILSVESLPAAPHVALGVFWDVQGTRCILKGVLPIPQTGKQYQLWLATPVSKNSVALLEPDPAGRVFMKVPLSPPAVRPATMQITLEPRGGSAQPSTDTYAAGKIN